MDVSGQSGAEPSGRSSDRDFSFSDFDEFLEEEMRKAQQPVSGCEQSRDDAGSFSYVLGLELEVSRLQQEVVELRRRETEHLAKRMDICGELVESARQTQKLSEERVSDCEEKLKLARRVQELENLVSGKGDSIEVVCSVVDSLFGLQESLSLDAPAVDRVGVPHFMTALAFDEIVRRVYDVAILASEDADDYVFLASRQINHAHEFWGVRGQKFAERAVKDLKFVPEAERDEVWYVRQGCALFQTYFFGPEEGGRQVLQRALNCVANAGKSELDSLDAYYFGMICFEAAEEGLGDRRVLAQRSVGFFERSLREEDSPETAFRLGLAYTLLLKLGVGEKKRDAVRSRALLNLRRSYDADGSQESREETQTYIDELD